MKKEKVKQYLYQVVEGKAEGLEAELLRFILLGLSFIYRLGVSILAWLYQSGYRKPEVLHKRVISVGNLTLGGSGKTPMVIYIAKLLLGRKWQPAIVTRGYMPEPGQKSDEVMMLQELLPNVPVLVGPDRIKSVKSSYANVFILDDGFQYWRLKRNLDIVVIDAESPFGNGWLLPRGTLREPVAALKRADVIVLSHVNTARENIQNVLAVIEEWAPRAIVVHTLHEVVGVSGFPNRVESKGLEVLRDRICLVSAIGSPGHLRRSVVGLGGNIFEEFTFMDHHVYTREDVENIIQACRKQGLQKVVTTHKDAVKLLPFFQELSGLTVLVVDIELRILHGENEFLSSIDSLLTS